MTPSTSIIPTSSTSTTTPAIRQVDLGVHMGLGSIATTILANYYNKSLTWNQGKMDVVMNMKGVGGQYNSFQNSAALLPYVERALVRSTEATTESQISAYPFQTELDIQGGNWHYMTGAGYTTPHLSSRR